MASCPSTQKAKTKVTFSKLCTSLSWWKDHMIHLIQDTNRSKGLNDKNRALKSTRVWRQKVYIITSLLMYFWETLGQICQILHWWFLHFFWKQKHENQVPEIYVAFQRRQHFCKTWYSTSGLEVASHFDGLCLVEAKNILTVLLELGDYYRKYYNFQRAPNPHFPPVPNILKGLKYCLRQA